MSEPSTTLTHACTFCDKIYQSKGGLTKHVKLHHSEESCKENEPNGKVLCDECNARLQNLGQLVEHKITWHNADCSITSHTFASITSFLDWKKAMELETNSMYVQHCSKQTSNAKSTIRWYYYCNRSGEYKPSGQGKRSLKMQGSSKLGYTCTAHIKVTQDMASGEITVQFCGGHNHAISLGHIPISENIRLLVARKLQEGVTIDKVMDSIRDTINGPAIKRDHLITRQDVNNIKRQYNIEGVQRHIDDQQSVCAWVEELRGLPEYNPVTAFKPQGNKSSNTVLSEDDFILCIQTSFQCDMMKIFGTKAICMDATHGTNHYNFKLVTVLVLDDFGEGLPVGWLISNKEDSTVLKVFLKSLLERTGPLSSEYFMSDDAEQYFSAWKEVYQGEPKKLLCSWHVDKAWRAKLLLITDKEKRANVYCCLRSILQTLSVAECRKLMQQAITWMLSDPSIEEFGKYFQTYYSNRIQEWAFCYRVGTPVNTNMSVEAFHRLLKVVYLESKHNRRVDHLLSVILRIARDKLFDRITKIEKGKASHRQGEINKRHRSAVTMMDDCCVEVVQGDSEDSMWKVTSQSSATVQYHVKRLTQDCALCKVRCSSCAVCVHMYSCSCVDNAIHSTACKHIHIVHMSNSGAHIASNSFSTAHQALIPLSVTSQTLNDLPSIKDLQTSHDTNSLNRKYRGLLRQLETFIEETDTDILQAGIPHLAHAVSVMNSMKKDDGHPCTLVPAIAIAPNTKSPPQPRFHSTKRRRIQTSKVLDKPTPLQVTECVNTLSELSDVVNVCGVCLKEDDKESDSLVYWIKCTNCSIWLHKTCVNVTTDVDTFVCSYCMHDGQT